MILPALFLQVRLGQFGGPNRPKRGIDRHMGNLRWIAPGSRPLQELTTAHESGSWEAG